MKKNILFIFLILGIAGAAYHLNQHDLFRQISSWTSASGAWGPGIFLLVYILACIFWVPSIVLTFSSGILFGIPAGFLLSLLGTGLGSLATFGIGRTLARAWVEKRIAKNQKFQRLAQALEQKGWKIIVLARLSPLFPFSIANYAFGTTRIRWTHYFLASMLGTIPSAFVYSYLGWMAGDFSSLQHAGRVRTWEEWGLLGLGLAATVGLSWYLGRIAKEKLE